MWMRPVFLIGRHELLQTFHRLLRSFVFRWVTLDPIGTRVLHQLRSDAANEIRSPLFELYDPPSQHPQVFLRMSTTSSRFRCGSCTEVG